MTPLAVLPAFGAGVHDWWQFLLKPLPQIWCWKLHLSAAVSTGSLQRRRNGWSRLWSWIHKHHKVHGRYVLCWRHQVRDKLQCSRNQIIWFDQRHPILIGLSSHFADGRNHMPCCEQQGVPDMCSGICRGEYFSQEDRIRDHFSCIQFSHTMINCVAGGLGR